jgi:O-antigen/teichoic acid export membrane protein
LFFQNAFSALRGKISNRPYAGAIGALVGGTAFSQALSVLALPLLTRLYSVSDFGYFQVYISLLTTGVVVAALRYEFAILLAQDGEQSANTLGAALASVVFVGSVSVLAVIAVRRFGLAPRLAGSFGSWMWLMPFAIAVAGVLQVQINWSLRNKMFASVARSKVTQVGGQLAVQVSTGMLHLGPLGLAGGDIAGRAMSAALLVRSDWRRVSTAFRQMTVRGIFAAANRYREFAFVSTGGSLLNTAGVALPSLLIGYLYGSVVLGLFALVDRVMGAPVLLVGQAISQVYMAEGGRLAGESPEALYSLFSRTASKLMLMALFPAVLVLLFAPWAFPFFLGAQWREAGIYALLLVPRLLLAFVAWPLSSTLLLLEKQRVQFVWDLGRMGLTVSTIYLSHKFGASPRLALGLFSVAMFFGYATYLLVCYHILKERCAEYRLAEVVVTQ